MISTATVQDVLHWRVIGNDNFRFPVSSVKRLMSHKIHLYLYLYLQRLNVNSKVRNRLGIVRKKNEKTSDST